MRPPYSFIEMKINKLLFVYVFSLSLLTAGSLFGMQTAAETLEAKVTYDPKRLDLAEPTPPYINATISLPRNYNASDINGSSILMEGVLSPNVTLSYVIVKFNKYVAVFDGQGVVDIIWLNLYHMGVVDPSVHRPYKVYLTITGNLTNTAGGTPFEGTGYIMVKMYTATPPPPPPPP